MVDWDKSFSLCPLNHTKEIQRSQPSWDLKVERGALLTVNPKGPQVDNLGGEGGEGGKDTQPSADEAGV